MNTKTFAPFAKPLYVMLKPVGAVCNLRCAYCYYLDKKMLYPDHNRFVLSDEMLERFIIQYMESQTQAEVLFTWHGGEALMRNRSFYEKAIELQKKHGRGRIITNSLQTNGTLLTDDWCKFFKDNNWLIGISLDGPQHCHDKYRKGVRGENTFVKVMKGVDLLRKHGVEYNALAVVNDYNVAYPLEFYNFFKSIDCKYIQFTPIVEQIDGKMAPWNVPADKWGKFLITIFKEWVKHDVGNFFIQYFDSTLANWIDAQPGVMEFNGDVYSCDHFVYPKFKLGNINKDSLTSMMYSTRQIEFGKNKWTTLPSQCKACKYLFACNGECPKNRIIDTATGEKGLNYLCQGYYEFFDFVAPYMEYMKSKLKNEEAPADIMEAIRRGEFMNLGS